MVSSVYFSSLSKSFMATTSAFCPQTALPVERSDESELKLGKASTSCCISNFTARSYSCHPSLASGKRSSAVNSCRLFCDLKSSQLNSHGGRFTSLTAILEVVLSMTLCTSESKHAIMNQHLFFYSDSLAVTLSFMSNLLVHIEVVIYPNPVSFSHLL